MTVEGGNKIIKYLMFFFNFIFFLCGAVIIIAGSLVLTKYSLYADFTGHLGNAVPIVLIIVGVFVLITGFMGCCGAIKENYCMVCTFAFIIIVILLLELAGGITAYALRDVIQENIKNNMKELMKDYPTEIAITELFDKMQEDLKCCGTNNYTDWYTILNDTVPASCCNDGSTNCVKQPNPANLYVEGCLEVLNDLLQNNIVIIGAIAIAVALIQVFGVVCACCLMRSIKGEYEVV